MITCPQCHTELPDEALFCTHCGASLQNLKKEEAPNPAEPAAQASTDEQAQSTPSFTENESASQTTGFDQSYQQQTYTNTQQSQDTYQQQTGGFQGQPGGYQNNAYQGYNSAYQGNAPYTAPYVSPHDHTADFDAEDISKNKVFAMASYILSYVGIIIALLAAPNSPYAEFHSRQALKLTIVDTLLLFISIFFFWTILIPIAGIICYLIIFVVRIICFFQVASGKAKDAPIVGSLPFLK